VRIFFLKSGMAFPYFILCEVSYPGKEICTRKRCLYPGKKLGTRVRMDTKLHTRVRYSYLLGNKTLLQSAKFHTQEQIFDPVFDISCPVKTLHL
jgi:hypothetical protein